MLIRTVCSPGLVFIFHDNLAYARWEAVAIVVYYCLADMQSSLAHEVLQFLPAAMGWNLLLLIWYRSFR
jgi:hypothetical protein